MKITELYKKYEKSGINGNPVISDEELKELHEKMLEFHEFLKYNNCAAFGMILNANSVQSMIWARETKF